MERIFVYGTLKPGQERWPILAPFVAPPDAGCAAAVRGTVFDTGYGWPAAVFDSAAGMGVVGVVLRLHPASTGEAIATLDAIEGVETGLFQRIRIEIDGTDCWTYHWPGSTAGFQPLGCWPPAPTDR